MLLNIGVCGTQKRKLRNKTNIASTDKVNGFRCCGETVTQLSENKPDKSVAENSDFNQLRPDGKFRRHDADASLVSCYQASALPCLRNAVDIIPDNAAKLQLPSVQELDKYGRLGDARSSWRGPRRNLPSLGLSGQLPRMQGVTRQQMGKSQSPKTVGAKYKNRSLRSEHGRNNIAESSHIRATWPVNTRLRQRSLFIPRPPTASWKKSPMA